MDINIPSQLVVKTAAQWAVDTTVYSNKRLLITSDVYFGSTDQRKFKIADGTQTWSQLDYFPDPVSLASGALASANSYTDSAVSVVQGDVDTHEARTDNPHSVTKSQVGLSNVDNTADASKPVSTAQAAADAAILSTAEAYTDSSIATEVTNRNNAITSAVAGLMDYRGVFDASVNAYPSSGGSGAAGAILKSDFWIISVAGTLPTGLVVNAGDLVIAKQDTPGNTQANWSLVEYNIGYTPENAANKDTDGTLAANSDTKYASQKATKTYVDTGLTTKQNTLTNNSVTYDLVDTEIELSVIGAFKNLYNY